MIRYISADMKFISTDMNFISVDINVISADIKFNIVRYEKIYIDMIRYVSAGIKTYVSGVKSLNK